MSFNECRHKSFGNVLHVFHFLSKMSLPKPSTYLQTQAILYTVSEYPTFYHFFPSYRILQTHAENAPQLSYLNISNFYTLPLRTSRTLVGFCNDLLSLTHALHVLIHSSPTSSAMKSPFMYNEVQLIFVPHRFQKTLSPLSISILLGCISHAVIDLLRYSRISFCSCSKKLLCVADFVALHTRDSNFFKVPHGAILLNCLLNTSLIDSSLRNRVYNSLWPYNSPQLLVTQNLPRAREPDNAIHSLLIPTMASKQSQHQFYLMEMLARFITPTISSIGRLFR